MLERYRHTGRNTMRNVVVTLLFGSITIVFVLWGLNPRSLGLDTVGVVADVNGEMISLADYQNEINRLTEMYGRYFGSQMPADAQRQMLRGEALKNLVQLELIAQGSAGSGVLVSDHEVKDQILTLPFLQKDGRFQREYYEGYVAQMRMTPAKFEKKVRKILANQKMSRVFEQAFAPASVISTKDEQLRRTLMNVQFLKITPDEMAKKVTVSDQRVSEMLAQPDQVKSLEAHFRANPEKFKKGKEDPKFADVQKEVAQSWLRDTESRNLVKELTDLVAKGDAKAIESWASRLGIKWDETGEFNLAAPRPPKLSDNETLLKTVFGLTEQKPWATQAVHDGGNTYVLKLKSRTTAKSDGKSESDDNSLMDYNNTQNSQEAMNQWTEKLRAKATVRENISSLE